VRCTNVILKEHSDILGMCACTNVILSQRRGNFGQPGGEFGLQGDFGLLLEDDDEVVV
jgi:hypothetical protein